MGLYLELMVYLTVRWRDMVKNFVILQLLAVFSVHVQAQSVAVKFDIVGSANNRLRPGESASIIAIAESPGPGVLELKIKPDAPRFGFDWDSHVSECEQKCTLRDTLTLRPGFNDGGSYAFTIVAEYNGPNGFSSRSRKVNIQVIPKMKAEPPFTQGASNLVCWFPVNAIGNELLYFPLTATNTAKLSNNNLAHGDLECQTIENLGEGIRLGYHVKSTILRDGQFIVLNSDTTYSTQDYAAPSPVILSDFSVDPAGSVTLRWQQPHDEVSYVDQYLLYRKTAFEAAYTSLDTLPVFPIKNISPQNYFPVRVAQGESIYLDREVQLLSVPEIIEDAAMIKAAVTDGLNELSDFLSFELNAPANIYIAFDKRTIKPEWLERSFRSTRINIRTSKNPEGWLRLWTSREVYQPGLVTLGGNFTPVNGSPSAHPDMYVVFVQPVDADFPYANDGLLSYTDALGDASDQQTFQYRIDAVDAAGNVGLGQPSSPIIVDLHGRCRPNISQWFVFQNDLGKAFGRGLSNRICIQDPASQAECAGFRETDSLRFQAARGNPELFEVHRDKDNGTIFFDSEWIALHQLESPDCYQFELLPAGKDPNFVNGQTYYYRVQAKDVHGNLSVWSDTVSAIQDAFPPEDIRSLRADHLIFPQENDGCISLNWQPAVDPVSGVGVYYIYRSDDGGTIFSIIDSVMSTETSYCDSLSRIGSNRVVHYRVVASDRVGNLRRLEDSDQTVSLRALLGPGIEIVDTPTIECPAGVFAVRDDTVFVHWPAFDGTGVSKFEVEISGPAGKSVVETSPSATPRAMCPLPGPDGLFVIRVRAFYPGGDITVYSNTIRVRKKSSLRSVDEFQALQDTLPTGDVLLSWSHPDGDEIIEFQIFNWAEGEERPNQPALTLPGDSLRWLHRFSEGGLVAYQCNNYLIRAIDCLGLVSLDTITTQYSNRPPAFEAAGTVIDNNDITVCWDRPAARFKQDDIFEAEVTVFQDSLGTVPFFQQRVFNLSCFTLFGAPPRHNYIFQVREFVLDDLGQSCADSFMSGLSVPLIVPLDNPPPVVRFDIQALPVHPDSTTGEVFLSWQDYAARNIDRFRVLWSVAAQPPGDSLAVVGADTVRVGDLEIDNPYRFTVYAIDNLGQVSAAGESKTVAFMPRWLFTPKIAKFNPSCFRDTLTIAWHWVDENGQPVNNNFGADSIIVELSIDQNFVFRKTSTRLDLRTEFMFRRSEHYPFVNSQNNRLHARIRAKDRWDHLSPWSTEYLELGAVSEAYDEISPTAVVTFIDSTKAPIFGGAGLLNVFLRWQEAGDNCSGPAYYEIMRDNVVIGRDSSGAAVHHFVDRGVPASAQLLVTRWSVHAVDRAGNRQNSAPAVGIPFSLQPPQSGECASDTTFCWGPGETTPPGKTISYFVEGARFVELFGNPETNVLIGPLEGRCVNFDVPWETVYWRVKARVDHFESAWSDTFFCGLSPQDEVTLARLNQSVSLPTIFDLKQNYPNPFNPETTIHYDVPSTGQNSLRVVLEIYNIAGQRLRTLMDEDHRPGKYSVIWNGRDDAGLPVGSGVFVYRMRADNFVATRKMVLLK